MKKIIWLTTLAVAIVIPQIGLAASFSIVLDKSAISVEDTFSATLKIDSEDAGVNAAQATINFTKGTFQVVSIDKSNSVFNFWLEETAYDNSTGQITLIGGSTAGFLGKALQAIKINLKATGSGPSNFVFSDGAITASDGSGTNLLSAMNGAQFTIGTGVGAPTPVQPAPPPTQAVPPPVQIQRPPAPAVATASKPTLNVSLYPDPTKWSNVADIFLVSWDLPPDVSAVSTAVNKDPAFAPAVSEGLFDNKYFKALDDGTWYAHVQFRNSLGWGTTMHYKISVDTVPPTPFAIRIDESTSTDNPTPTFRFGTSDQPSGIDRYRIKVGDEEPVQATSTILKLPLQAPGTYNVVVRAYDKAGNITEERINLQILPIASPTITSVSKDTYLGEGPLQVSGGTPPGTVATVSLLAETGELVSSAEMTPDQNGNWNTSFGLPQRGGNYYIGVVSKDKRGALSLEIKSAFNVRQRPLFIIFGLEITSGTLAFFLLLILICGFFAGYFAQKLAKEQRGRKVIVVERDISIIFNLLRKDLNKMLSDYEDGMITESESKEMEFYLKRMRDTLDKTKRYMIENVEEMKD